MKKIIEFFKKEMMLAIALIAAIISLIVTPPTMKLLKDIDFKTLCILFMLLSVLDGFKHERLFDPFIKMANGIKSLSKLSLFLVFCVFFSSCFVTNDVSLIIFVPLTLMLFKQAKKEEYIIPVLVLENIAAVRGSLLTPFGSPQNLYLFSKSNMDAISFLKMMFPLFWFSAVLLVIFTLFICRKELKEKISYETYKFDDNYKGKKSLYLILFVVVIFTIVSRTTYWPYITMLVLLALFVFDRDVFKRVDYVLILTFLCFFVFSSSIASNKLIGGFLMKSVSNHEYIWSIGLSQIISNVPASIVLWPFTSDLKALIYGLDSAGLITIIGSLASVINLRIYQKDYPSNGMKFMLDFMKISIIFFLILQPYQLYLMAL